MMHLYGIGDHGGGPTRAMLDSGLHWSSPTRCFRRSSSGGAQGFFSDVEEKLDTGHSPVWNYKTLAKGDNTRLQPATGKMRFPVWNDELYFEYHRGVFTTQANHKRNMRESEERVLNAEKYSSLAWLDGQSYPGAEAYRGMEKGALQSIPRSRRRVGHRRSSIRTRRRTTTRALGDGRSLTTRCTRFAARSTRTRRRACR